MYKIILSLCFLSFSIQLFSQDKTYGNRNMVEQDVFIPNFHRIEAFGEFNIVLRQDSVPSLKVVTDENHVADIEIKSVEDKLVIKDLNQVEGSSCHLYLHYNMLKSVELFGLVHLENELLCTFDTLSVKLNGGSSMNMLVETKKIIAHQSTNSKLTLSGHSNHANYNLNQNSKLNTKKLDCLNTYLETFDNSTAEMLANFNFIGFLNDLSKLKVYGKSTDINVNVADLSLYTKL